VETSQNHVLLSAINFSCFRIAVTGKKCTCSLWSCWDLFK